MHAQKPTLNFLFLSCSSVFIDFVDGKTIEKSISFSSFLTFSYKQRSIRKFGKEHYSNEYASRYLSEATKKLEMYTEIFESYRPELKEAERYLLLLELTGGKG